MASSFDKLSTVESFLDNQAFRRWVLERRPDDRAYWQQWLILNPEKRELYEQAVATLLVLQGTAVPISDQQAKEKAEQIIERMPTGFSVIRPLWRWGRWAAAASIVGVLIWWQMGKPFASQPGVAAQQSGQVVTKSEWKIVRNVTGQPQVVLLPDNSSVLLSSGSQLRFQKQNTHPLREVYLEGEGFFEVSKNPARPFVVYTANLTTKVLGTSFQVRSFDKETAAYVKVKTGKVFVTPVAMPDKPVMLTVNEQLSLTDRTDKIIKRNVVPSKESPHAIVSQSFTFEFSPVSDVFSQLEASYHMPIHYDRQLLANCTFTGKLNDAPFLEKIRLICLTIESTFEVIDNQVVIHSRGCS